MSLYEILKEYNNKDVVRFHMPGHKGRGETPLDVYGMDITEIEGFDDLHNPKGSIMEIEESLRKLYGAGDAILSVNGSTGGILAAIFSLINEGDKVLMSRGCHKSVYNALMLKKARPVYINTKTDRTGCVLPVEVKEITEIISEETEIKLGIFTNPSYEGVLLEQKDIYKAFKEKGIPLLIDGAHGAHVGIICGGEGTIIEDSDVAVVSLHKSLPFLTQTSCILTKDKTTGSLIRKYMSCFETSSPSYLLMAAAENALRLLQSRGESLSKQLGANLDRVYALNKELKNISVIDKPGRDRTKLVIYSEKEDSSALIYNELRRDGIEPEMVTERYCLLMASVCNNDRDFDRLIEALKKIDTLASNLKIEENREYPGLPVPKQALSMHEAFAKSPEYVGLKEAAGRISAGFVDIFPPGIPMLVPGEVIKSEHIALVKNAKAYNINIRGIKDSRLPVI